MKKTKSNDGFGFCPNEDDGFKDDKALNEQGKGDNALSSLHTLLNSSHISNFRSVVNHKTWKLVRQSWWTFMYFSNTFSGYSPFFLTSGGHISTAVNVLQIIHCTEVTSYSE